MPTIEGSISPTGYIHLKYGAQTVDGMFHGPYDAVIAPKDEKGTVSFTVPQGINVTIELYSTMGGSLAKSKIVTIPKSDRAALADLLR